MALPAAPRTVHEFAEDILENVGEAAEILRASAHAAILEGGVAEAVVGGALLRILQAVIGLADRLEFGLSVPAAAIAIGMALHGQAAIGGLDRLLVRRPRNLEQFVIIGIKHDGPRRPSPRRKPGSQGEGRSEEHTPEIQSLM